MAIGEWIANALGDATSGTRLQAPSEPRRLPLLSSQPKCKPARFQGKEVLRLGPHNASVAPIRITAIAIFETEGSSLPSITRLRSRVYHQCNLLVSSMTFRISSWWGSRANAIFSLILGGRPSFANATGQRNDNAIAAVQLDAYLTAFAGSDLPPIFKDRPGATF
jgi:hypothetical protein